MLATALSEAQKVLKNAAMNRTNSYFQSKYATLSSIWEAVREALPPHGLSVTQSTHIDDGNLILVTTLFHKSGQYISSEFPIIFGGKPQDMGSQMTYVKRYQLSAIVGLAADDDDDGNAAQEAAQPQGRQPRRPAADVINELPANMDGNQVDPHQIVVPQNPDGKGFNWIVFGQQLIAYMRASPTSDEAIQWQSLNEVALHQMENDTPKAFSNLKTSMMRIVSELERKERKVEVQT